MSHFQNFQTADDIKSEYRRLAKRLHPDHGGSTESMQALNAEYEVAIDRAVRFEKPGLTEQEYTDLAAVNETVRRAVEAIVNLPDIEIEICGLWVWVGGTARRGTSAQMDLTLDSLVQSGYKWASKKVKWYFAGVKATSHGKMDMDDIRAAHGSTIVKRNERKAIAGA